MGMRGSRAVEPTDDGRFIVVDGRRWRATDPRIPESLRAELVGGLMRARRLVKGGGDAARPMVHDAKLALGERGEPWWEEGSEEGRRTRLGAAMRTLLRHRDGTTICPSDAARVVGGEDWRDLMALAREVAPRRGGRRHTAGRPGRLVPGCPRTRADRAGAPPAAVRRLRRRAGPCRGGDRPCGRPRAGPRGCATADWPAWQACGRTPRRARAPWRRRRGFPTAPACR